MLPLRTKFWLCEYYASCVFDFKDLPNWWENKKPKLFGWVNSHKFWEVLTRFPELLTSFSGKKGVKQYSKFPKQNARVENFPFTTPLENLIMLFRNIYNIGTNLTLRIWNQLKFMHPWLLRNELTSQVLFFGTTSFHQQIGLVIIQQQRCLH